LVDFAGRESPLSDPVSLPAPGQLMWPLTTFSDGSGGICQQSPYFHPLQDVNFHPPQSGPGLRFSS